jgi:hypothetical protein
VNIVIAGAREREETERDKEIVEGLICRLAGAYGRRLNVVSVGCDKGVGKIAREFCMANEIIFVENRMKLEGKDIPRSFFVHVFQARNPAMVALGDEFYVFKGPNENGIVEEVIELAREKVGAERVWIYESGATDPMHPPAIPTLDELANEIAEKISNIVVSATDVLGFRAYVRQELNRLVDRLRIK